MMSIDHRVLLTRRVLLTAALPASALSQAAKPTPGKGVWEPVSYTEDIELTDVAFVTPDVGWVSGDKGTILHTKDGGKTWEAQLGGDPAAADPKSSGSDSSTLLESVQPKESGSPADGAPSGEATVVETQASSEVFLGPVIAAPKLKKIDLLLTALGTTVSPVGF